MVYILVSDNEEMDQPIVQALQGRGETTFLVDQSQFIDLLDGFFSDHSSETVHVIWGASNVKVSDCFGGQEILQSAEFIHSQTTAFFIQMQKLLNLSLYHAYPVRIWTLAYDYTMSMVLDAPCNPMTALGRVNLVKAVSRESGRRKITANHIYMQPYQSSEHKAGIKNNKVRASLWKKGLKLLSQEELAQCVTAMLVTTPDTVSGNVFEVTVAGTNIGINV